MTTVTHLPDDVLDPVAECLTPDVARRILAVRLKPAMQARVDELAAKASVGTLSPKKRAEYEEFIDKADLLGLFKAVARQALSRP